MHAESYLIATGPSQIISMYEYNQCGYRPGTKNVCGVEFANNVA